MGRPLCLRRVFSRATDSAGAQPKLCWNEGREKRRGGESVEPEVKLKGSVFGNYCCANNGMFNTLRTVLFQESAKGHVCVCGWVCVR